MMLPAALVDEQPGTRQRGSVAVKGRQIETESAPIRYVAELMGLDMYPSVPYGGILP